MCMGKFSFFCFFTLSENVKFDFKWICYVYVLAILIILKLIMIECNELDRVPKAFGASAECMSFRAVVVGTMHVYLYSRVSEQRTLWERAFCP